MAVTLVEFLLARVVENEARAEELHNKYDCASVDRMMPFPCDCGVPAWVLAECQARRAVIEEFEKSSGMDYPLNIAYDEGLEMALTCLVQPFKDHPDFDPEWLQN